MSKSKYQQAAAGFLPIRSAGRSKSPSFEGDTRITPVASPTNQYAGVGPTPRSGLWDLASSLSEFESSLQGLISARQKEQDEADLALAEKQFIENNEDSYAEAVRTGRIPAYASPAFVKSYKAAEGRKVAREVTASVFRNYETWDGKDADDASGYSPWIAEQVRQGLAGIDDPEVLRAAFPGIRGVAERKGAEHAEYVGRRVMARAVEGIGKDIIGTIDNASGEPVPGPDGKLITHEGLADAIATSVAEGRRIGIPDDRLNEVAAEAVVAKAIAARDYARARGLIDVTLEDGTDEKIHLLGGRPRPDGGNWYFPFPARMTLEKLLAFAPGVDPASYIMSVDQSDKPLLTQTLKSIDVARLVWLVGNGYGEGLHRGNVLERIVVHAPAVIGFRDGDPRNLRLENQVVGILR